LIETLAPRLTGDAVRIEGLAGRFPTAVRIDRLTVADRDGVWLTVDGAALDWSPLRLVQGEVTIGRLEAASVTVGRLPVPASDSSGGVSMPALRGTLSRLRVARLEIAPAIAGRPIALAVDGAGEIAARDTGEAHLSVAALQPRADAPLDHYLIEISIDPAHLHATLSVAEAAHGLIAGLAQLPDLGAIALTASIDGPLNALAAKAAIEAGSLRGTVNGRADLVANTADLRFAVVAPAMTPGSGIGWSSIRLEGRAHGPFAAPEAAGTFSADALTAAGAEIGSLRADISGDASGKTKLHASLDGVRVPGPSPGLLAGGALTMDASIQLADARHPIEFSVKHALFSAEGAGDTERGRMRLTVPDLVPFAAIDDLDLGGHTEFEITASRSNGAIDLTVTGGIGIAGGKPPIDALVGDSGKLALAASVRGDDVRLRSLSLSGAGFNATANGQFVDQVLNLDWTLGLNDLSAIRPELTGTIAASGHAGGALSSLSINSDLTGNLAVAGDRPRQVGAHLTLDGLPTAPSGRFTAGGTLLDAPLDLAIGAERKDGIVHIAIDRINWKSLTGGGALDFAAGESLPSGKVSLSMTNLADLAPLLGQPIAGDVTASVDASPGAARIKAVVTGGAIAAAGTVTRMALDATIADPAGTPMIDGALTLDGIAAGGVRASGRLAGNGPLDAMALTLAADSAALSGQPARLESAGTLNATGGTLSLASLRGTWGRETVRLLAPARIVFAPGVVFDRLRLGFRQGELAIEGRSGGAVNGLDLHATLVNLPADMLAVMAPDYAADGSIGGEARLTGSFVRPAGTVHIQASGLRLRAGTGRALPAASATVDAALDGSGARVDAKAIAGASSVTLGGRVPLGLAGTMAVRVGGTVDLAMLNPLVAAQGRNVRGRLDLSLAVGGTLAVPRASGTVGLAGGDFQDSSLGVHISAMTATARIDGNTVRLDRFDGKAGPGTISGGGSVVLAGAPAVELSLRASNARILSSDLMTALIDADLTLRGTLIATPVLGGTLHVRTAEIRVPERLPPSIAVLPVREAGARPTRKPSPPPAAAPDVALNVTLDAPGQIYIRGRGVDAELGGRVTFAGTATHPLPHGGLQLRRGTFSLAGVSLNLTEGTIDFSGGPLTNPPLKLVATSRSAALTSTLTISGDVRSPKIALASVPDLPQDEILSALLFNTAKGRLSPFQVAQIAAALASLSGVGPSIGDPLGGVRSALGLDQLGVGSDAGGGTRLEAGRYLAPGVRVGASQSVSGGGAQATVQIDIAKGLKLETTAGTGSAAAPAYGGAGVSNGTSVGLTYQFEY